MDTLQDLLGRYAPKEPEEIRAVKGYITEHFQVAAAVAIKGEAIMITVGSASLANTLRFHTRQLQALCPTYKRIVLRIG